MKTTNMFERTPNATFVKEAFEETQVTAQENKVLELAALLSGMNSIDEAMLDATRQNIKTLVDQILTFSQEVNENLTIYNSRILDILPLELSEEVKESIENYNTRVTNVLDDVTTQEAANDDQYEVTEVASDENHAVAA